MIIGDKSYPALYAAFDLYPSAKGAATHIEQAASTLFEYLGGGLLYVLGNESLPRYQKEKIADILRFSQLIDNYLNRALAFSYELNALFVSGCFDHLKIAHFRDPWSGHIIIRQKKGKIPLVYEVNGLPSIELPITYPNLSRSTLQKISNLEKECLNGADILVVPSKVIRDNLIKLGIDPSKIRYIPNGTIIHPLYPQPQNINHPYVLYFGALQKWQGLEVLLSAWKLLSDFSDYKLVICSSVKSARLKFLQKMAIRLEIDSRIIWLHQLDKVALQSWVQHAYLTVAPLTESERNIDQGCCPLKIIESMGAGVPVIASDLPVVRELIEHRTNGYLVRPDRPNELARVMRVLFEYPERVREMGNSAKVKIINEYLWEHANSSLISVYNELKRKL